MLSFNHAPAKQYQTSDYVPGVSTFAGAYAEADFMIKKVCMICGKDFNIYPSEIKYSRGKYCSLRCRDISYSKTRNKRVPRICQICGKEFKAKAYKVKEGNAKFCSRKCMGVSMSKIRVGAKNHQWKGGMIVKRCMSCGQEFKTLNCAIKKGYGKFCSRRCSVVWQVAHQKKTGTSIEIKMEYELTLRGVVFKKQYPIWQAKTIPDFFIAPNICIYCDGDYWHKRNGVPERDAQQNFMLKFLGYKVYRFWEHNIKKDVSKCVSRIKGVL